uniref:RNA polymerase I-specific transcription initiation factor RRN6-like protein n=1 Tax=Bionectria ochroleuca TaxID=29856 RepID=A0A8H7NDR7_BIOOC
MAEMVDWSQPARPVNIPVLASVTGESGELLRLARIEDSKWKWDEDEHSILHLSVIDPVDQDDELIWESDGLPISQVKYVSSAGSRYEAIRWIIVQKETSTVILQPEYQPIPLSTTRNTSSGQGQSSSRIKANPILTLWHHETGGNAHADVTFNVPADGSPPQLCVIDECGYWTLWNIYGKLGRTATALRLTPLECGHIWEGSLGEIPAVPLYPAEVHGALFIGSTDVVNITNDPFAGFESEQGPSLRSRHLLLWNRERLNIVDVEANQMVVQVPGFSSATSNFGHIVDVQMSPANRRHVLVMTERFIVWIDVFPLNTESDQVFTPSIILTCPHSSVAKQGMRMNISHITTDEQDNVMIAVCSSEDLQLELLWFTLTPEKGLSKWHSQLTQLPRADSNRAQSNFRTFILHPVLLESLTPGQGVGSLYLRNGCQFYQGMILGQDLSVKYCICFSIQDPTLEVTLPTTRLKWTPQDQNRRWRKKRIKLLRHMGDKFILPDSMSYMDKQLLDSQPQARSAAQSKAHMGRDINVAHGPISLRFDTIARHIRMSLLRHLDQDSSGLPTTLIDSVQNIIQQGLSSGRLPLFTWLEINNGLDEGVIDRSGTGEATHEDLEDLVAKFGDEAVITQLRCKRPGAPPPAVGWWSQPRDQLSRIWLEPLREKMSRKELALRHNWITELGKELFLATQGTTVQDVPLFGTMLATQESQAETLAPASIRSSPLPSLIPSSSPIMSRAPDPDAAIQRLRLLAPGVQPGKLGTSKPASVLSHWPAERGVDPSHYTSSVFLASESQHDEAKQRLQKIEAKRRSMAEKYKRPALMRKELLSSQAEDSGGLPSLQTGHKQIPMSSQEVPASSQSQGPMGFTMSQPVSGVFGERKKTKKPKKKSGFR